VTVNKIEEKSKINTRCKGGNRGDMENMRKKRKSKQRKKEE
jgi:hypothetical protein